MASPRSLALVAPVLLSTLGLFGCAAGGAEEETSFTTFDVTTLPGDGDGDLSETGTASGDGDGDASGDGDGDMTTTAGAECGNGIVEEGEQCDLGADNSDTGQCTSSCLIASCGDGLVYEGFEECDDGNAIQTDDCLNSCESAYCGDGFVHEGVEECDDGNDDEADGCSSQCTPGVCGDGVIQEGEQCDDGNDNTTDDCPACQFAFCGDGFIQAGVEICDDGNLETNDGCISPLCIPAECGDGFVWEGMEECDDANLEDSDACPSSCQNAFCGDGFAQEGVEECDDGNDIEDDACTNDCISNFIPLGDILLGGNSFSQIQTALNTVGEPYMVNNSQWLQPNAADVLIMSNNGGGGGAPNYTAHLDAGGHVLMIGGSSLAEFYTFIDSHIQTANNLNSWHQATDCVDDWNTGPDHPMTSMLPESYEFGNQSISFHMAHFADAGQPNEVELLGRTCHAAPDNHVLATRHYDNGGSFTYMALHLGPYDDANFQADFLVPFLQGYFMWLQMGTP